MDEKILELLQKMNNNITEMKKDINDLKIGQVETNDRFDSIDKRFDGIENRLDSMDKRFDSIENRLDSMEKKQDILYNQAITTAENITEIREDLGDVQVTTTCNLNDLKELKKLKSVK
ncbi:hypothetical protein [Clostridioides difficile]|uniref:hypothetical protein n=1 Tax=Clostridioides difficile TaxID=1496 RepID=UPI001C164964|nr:hypothetical protein [Clostridioides difficile]MDF3817623.1 hypothetical protein [Clostridioides difficile]HBF4283297.1 hypothetical protein [Clostridioides difficile]HBF5048952.1 hypothetical protein [Clostridioides difficile]HBF5114847.1 hypothetical protein [Clostridioides difficile]HBF5876787.1 hypothetical protein [Clostridioides difficile]